MKTAIVTLAQLAQHDRWDAGFHIALAHHQTSVDRLKGLMTEAAARAACKLFTPAQRRESLEGLASRRDEKAYAAVADKHPHLALAVLLAEHGDTTQRRQELHGLEDDLDRIDALVAGTKP